MKHVTKSLNDICNEFNRVPWHDSKLIGLEIRRDQLGLTAENNVAFDLKLRVGPGSGIDSLRDTKLLLKSCTVIRMNLDLSWKRMVSDDISSATCSTDSDLKREIERQLTNENKPLESYLHFTITLIPPAGDIHIFARDFEMTP